jgi:hypothetical protein
LILIDALSSDCWEKKRKRDKEKKELAQGLFFIGPDTPCWLCHVGFLRLSGAIKG